MELLNDFTELEWMTSGMKKLQSEVESGHHPGGL